MRDIVLADPTEKIQHHRLLNNIKSRQVSHFAVVPVSLASSKDPYATFTRVWSVLSEQDVKLAMAYLMSSHLTSVPLVEDFCTALIALRARLLKGSFHSFEIYRQEFYSAVFTMSDEARRHAAATNLFFFETLQTKVLFPISTKIVTIQGCIIGSLSTFLRAKLQTNTAQPKCV